MISTQRWRDRQLTSFTKFSLTNTILEQEQVMCNFMSKFGDINWYWAGDSNNLKNICSSIYNISNINYRGIIIFGQTINNLTTGNLVTAIRNLIEPVDYAYVAVNRYLLASHDLPINLPDSISDSLDVIMQYCHPSFKRLHTFAEVDGNHMVGAHPLDCYGLCK